MTMRRRFLEESKGFCRIVQVNMNLQVCEPLEDYWRRLGNHIRSDVEDLFMDIFSRIFSKKWILSVHWSAKSKKPFSWVAKDACSVDFDIFRLYLITQFVFAVHVIQFVQMTGAAYVRQSRRLFSTLLFSEVSRSRLQCRLGVDLVVKCRMSY